MSQIYVKWFFDFTTHNHLALQAYVTTATPVLNEYTNNDPETVGFYFISKLLQSTKYKVLQKSSFNELIDAENEFNFLSQSSLLRS